MEIGLRVVRGPDWMWEEQDGGEGNVGTVVRLGKDGNRVSVYWDSGKQSNCRAGQSGKFDLRVYDNAPTGVKHASVTCDNCRQFPIAGTRWKCADCPDYDLCSPCYMSDVHFKQHSFLRFDESGADGVPVDKRSNCTKQQPEGFFPGARVTRGRDWKWGERDGGNGQIGTLTELTTWNGVQRAGAKITWKHSRSLCRIGHMGSVDLKCSTPATGPPYYSECLAKVGEIQRRPDANHDQLRVGDRVSVCLDVEVLKAMSEDHGGWVDDMEQCIGKVGKISKIDSDGDVHVSYGLHSWVFHPGAVTKMASFLAGDKVRIKSDKQLVQNLQQGHGGWKESMSRALGKEGEILEMNSDGNAVVLVDSDPWLMNPAALENLSDWNSSSRQGETSPSSSEDKATELLKMLLQGGDSEPGDRLVKASGNGNLNDVREILEANPGKIDHKKGGMTALHVACHQGEAEIVKYLLGKDADKDIKYSDNKFGTLITGRLKEGGCLIGGFNRGATDEQGYTALHHAAYGDRSGETVTAMLNAGTNVNVCNNKNKSTPLHLAVHQGNKAGVKALLASQQCDVNSQDLAGDTPLHDAISKGKNTIVDLILGSQVLDITVCNAKGFNPLHRACLKGNLHAVQKIAERYPDVIEIPKEDGFTALHLSALNNHKDIARYILSSGHCDVNSRNNEDQTPLALAVSEEYKAMIKLLIEHGADVNAADEDGDTPLHVAVMHQAVGSTGLRGLLQGIAGLNLPDGAKTDKHTGCAVAVYLALHGANINFYNHKGKTPLDLCQDDQTANLIKQFAREVPRQTCTLGRSSFTHSQAARGTDTSPPGSPLPRPSPVTSAPASVAHRQRETQDTESAATDCMVCSKSTATVTFNSCGHKVTCSVCSFELKRCPKCNAAVQQKAAAQVPSEIKARGPRARLAFENALKTGKVKVYRARIMLIGQDRAGKTSFKNTLLGLPFDPKQQSTDGIAVDPSRFDVDVDQIKNWQRTDAKFDVSHFETDLVKMVAEKLKEEEEKEQEQEQQEQEQEQEEKDEEEEEEEEQQQQQQKQQLKEQRQQEQTQEQQQKENQCRQTEESLLTQVNWRNKVKKWKNKNNKDRDTDSNQTEKTQEVQGVPLMASHNKNRQPVTPDLNIDPVLPSAKFTDLLVQYLEGLNLQTDGTSIEHHMTLDLWDFAGQHLYYASYPAFLSPRALYMLVYNLSKGLKDTAEPCFRQGVHDIPLSNPNNETNLENLLSWLVSVNTMCSSNPVMDGDKESRKDQRKCHPPVFIIGTHADEPHQDIKEMEVQIQKEIVGKDYEGHVIRPFFSIDNTQGNSCEGVGELQKRMLEVLKQEPYMGEEVPLRWFIFEKVVQALVAAKKYYLNLDQLQTIIQQVCFIEDEDEVVTMLDFYHDLGMIVKHRNTVVLQAQWLIDVFKQLITIRSFNDMERGYSKLWKAMETTGALSVELVDHVFSKFCQEGLTRDDILHMMEQFGLIVKFATSPTDEKYFVPCQLRTPPDDLEMELSPVDPCPLYLHFLGGFVPHGLFSQLVSRCTRWCSESGFKRPPNLFDGAACFFIEKELNHRLILICKKRFIEVILKQMKQKHKVSLAEAKGEKVTIVVRRFLEDTMQNLSSELPWLQNLTYELCVECPYCLKTENKCPNHGEVPCTHEDCMCLLQVPPDGLLSYCPNSYNCDEIQSVPRLEMWFPIRDMSKEEVQISAESKKVSSCSTSQLPETMDRPADQKCADSEVPCARDGLDKRVSQRTSQELYSSTSVDAARSRSGNSGETLKVALLANEWGSCKGGLSTINRTLAILLAKHSKVDATLLVPQFECSEEDKRTAQSHNISVSEAQRRPGFSDPLDWLSFPPKDLAIDIVIGHGAKLGKQAQVIRESHHCKWLQVVHTDPEELAMHKDYGRAIAKGEEKNRAEVDLCKLADLVVAVGPKLAETFSPYLYSSHEDVFQLTPGIFADFAEVKHSVQETAKFKVLTFGRGDPEDLSLKGYDIAASAIVELKDSSYRLIFVGAPDGKQDEVAETLLKTGISKNQLIVRSFVQKKERLKELFCEVDVAIMTSRTEGFGLTALEAMSAGLPILVSGNSGLGQAMRSLPFGMSFVVESEKPKKWAKAIAAVRQKSRTQRLKEVKIMQGIYEETYNWKKQCTSLIERMWKMAYGVDTPSKDKSHVKNCTGDDAARQTASDTHFPQGADRSPRYKAPMKNCEEDAAVGQLSHGVERASGYEAPLNNCEEDAAVIGQMTDRELIFGVLQDMIRDARKATSNADLPTEMKNIASDKGFMISDNQGEGNCMFHALSEQLNLVKGIQISYEMLRHNVVDYLKNNPELPDGTELFNFVDGHSSWDQYLTNMEEDGTWGDHVILYGAANCFRTCIHVVSSLSHQSDVIINPEFDLASNDQLVLGHVNELHYVSLIKVKEGSPSDEELEGLSRRIRDWKPLGRRLKFDEGMLRGFHRDNEECSERAYAMLIAWKEREGSAATYQVLHQALCHKFVDHRDLADEICCNCEP